jgi:predicted DNA binding CopG/RHH family protein
MATLVADDFDTLIKEKEAELKPLTEGMEGLKHQFISETANFAAKWFEGKAKEYVTKYPEITLNLSKERLAEMKVKVNSLA